MTAALLIDFGSTFTKLRAVDLDKAEIIGSGQGPSTVSTDVTEGLNAALKDMESRIGRRRISNTGSRVPAPPGGSAWSPSGWSGN